MLEVFNFRIAHVLFDSTLPNFKVWERERRHQAQVNTLWKAKERTSRGRGDRIKVQLSDIEAYSTPFFVPSIFESLQEGQYASVTRKVPGEADPYLALVAARYERAVIFTNDSDLWLYDSGPTTTIAYLKSLEVGPESPYQELSGFLFDPAHFAEVYHLEGMLEPAFLMSTDHRMTIYQAIASVNSSRPLPDGFPEFACKYALPPPLRDTDSRLLVDTRLEEVIEQIQSTSNFARSFLGILAEDPSRRYAWFESTPVRQLAYSILALPFRSLDCDTIYEYVRKRKEVRTERVDFIPQHELKSSLLQWRDWFRDTLRRASLPTEAVAWRYVGLRVLFSLMEWEKVPSSHEALHLLIKGDEPEDWYRIHLQAQHTATLYSIRMLKQACQVVDHGAHWSRMENSPEKKEIIIAVRSLKTILSDLPSISWLMGKGLFNKNSEAYMRSEILLDDYYRTFADNAPSGHGPIEYGEDRVEGKVDRYRPRYDDRSEVESDDRMNLLGV